MAITGISALSGQQIIASGACSARSAATASYTTGGNDIQGLYTTVNSNSAAWAVGTTYTGDAQGALDEVYSKSGDWNTVTSKQAAGDYYSASNPSGFITGVDLTPYQTTAGMTAYQPAGDYLTTSDSANFYTTANESGFITGIPSTYLQNTDLTISEGKITEISGVPLSAGDELPSGLMNESALEYNAVNEISGYNGSAIAQYGAEKQWLQHDDTLLHVANSAQYALGVNVSAVQSLMNVSPISACITQVNLTATGNAGAINKVVTKVTADIPAGWEFMTWTTFRTVGWIGSVYPGGITNSAVDIWGVYGGNYASTATCKVDCGYLIRKTI